MTRFTSEITKSSNKFPLINKIHTEMFKGFTRNADAVFNMSKWEHVRLRIETKQDLSEVKQVEMTDEPTLSTHILDTSIGKAVKNVIITVYKLVNDAWTPVCQSETDSDGRVSQLLSTEQYQGGVFKLSFDVKPYFAANKIKSFYPFIEIIVECEYGQHYHVPLLLNPFGYSTYRGT